MPNKTFLQMFACRIAFVFLSLVAVIQARADSTGLGQGLVPGGLFYQWYQGAWNSLPNLSAQTPAGYGIASGFDLSVIPASQNFAVSYQGYIDIAVAGQFKFYTTSDDGSALYIGDSPIPVVNNDGLHGMQTRWGSVVLQPGRYAFRVVFFQQGGAEGLSVGYTTPDGFSGAIPFANLSYDPALLPAPLEPDLPTGNLYPGLAYGYYQGDWSQLPPFDSLQPFFQGVSPGFDITDRLGNYSYAFRHQGYLVVPEDGLYTFYLASDDGSALYIGNQKLINNDGLHALREFSASILLKAGVHRITSAFFQEWGDAALNVQWSGPSFAKSAIPPEALLYSVDMLPPLIQPDTPKGPLLPQLAYRYYEGNWWALPDFKSLQPKSLGTAASIDLTPAARNWEYGLSFTGYINVPKDGVYRFYTTSDDGSRLWIGGTAVVNNDGPHGPVRAYGSIALAAGIHAIRVDYFQAWGGQQLSVEYRTPDGTVQVVPLGSLFHSADQLPPLIDAVPAPANIQNGLAYAYVEGWFTTLSPMQAATPRSHGVVGHFTLDPRGRDNGYGFVYDGYINVPEDGYYQFSTESDDGSRLWIGDTLVVDNDGLHADQTVYGSIGLKAGLHSIRVAYLQYGGVGILHVGYQTPSGATGEIPAAWLQHSAVQFPTLQAATQPPASVKPGVAYRYYEGAWPSLPDFTTLTPVGLGAVSNFSLESAASQVNYGFSFDGYIQVPVDGFYDFYTNSDDGSRLWIDGTLVVDNDGLHASQDALGNVGLAAGWHRIRVGFFQRWGLEILSVSWTVPGGQRSAIPNSALIFDPSSLPTLQAPVAAGNALVSGLQYAYYEWNQSQPAWMVLPDLTKLTPNKTGTVASFDITPRKRDNYYAFRFTGYINIPEYGYYTFFTASDDGSRLYIDNQLVVNNDGLHPLLKLSGRIGLEPGYHAITVDFFQWAVDQVLNVSYAGPHFAEYPVTTSVLFQLAPNRNGDTGNPGPIAGPSALTGILPLMPVPDQASTGIGAGQGVAINVIANDLDPNGDVPILLGIDSSKGLGAAVANQTTGSLVYYPPLGFVGQDQLSYTVADRLGGVANGQVTIQVGAGVNPLMSAADAVRFLTQATFGPTKASIADVMQKGPEAWINEQLALPPTTQADALNSMILPGELPSVRQLRVRAWLDRAVNAPDQLRQRVAFALSEIVVISDVGNVLSTDVGAPGAADYYDLLLRDAFGSYRQLLGDVTLHPAMGLFLNMAGNAKADPTRGTVADENYAREIMQLFSVGLWSLGQDGHRLVDANGQAIPTYAESDVMGLAKVFTGWNFAATSGVNSYTSPMALNPSLHDDSQKTVLGGAVIPAGQGATADLQQALNVIAAHPNLPPFIARRLIQRLVTSNPSPAYIGRVASAFSSSGLNLGVAVKAILLDPEARTAPAVLSTGVAASDGKVREPLLQLTALWRGLGIAPTATRLRLAQLAPLGQTPLSAPTVFNFFMPDYQSPGTIANLRLYSPELQILDEKQVMGSASVIDDWTLGASANYNLSMELAYVQASANKATGHLNLLFMGNQMSGTMQQVIANTMFNGTGLGSNYSDSDRQTRMLGAVYLILTSPEFQTER